MSWANLVMNRDETEVNRTGRRPIRQQTMNEWTNNTLQWHNGERKQTNPQKTDQRIQLATRVGHMTALSRSTICCEFSPSIAPIDTWYTVKIPGACLQAMKTPNKRKNRTNTRTNPIEELLEQHFDQRHRDFASDFQLANNQPINEQIMSVRQGTKQKEAKNSSATRARHIVIAPWNVTHRSQLTQNIAQRKQNERCDWLCEYGTREQQLIVPFECTTKRALFLLFLFVLLLVLLFVTRWLMLVFVTGIRCKSSLWIQCPVSICHHNAPLLHKMKLCTGVELDHSLTSY